MASKITNHCWIRELNEDNSSHRVGCITMKRMNANTVKVAFSLCSPADRHLLDLTKAKRLALRRLNEFKTAGLMYKVDEIRSKLDWADALGIAKTVMKHVKAGRQYDWARNNRALAGLLLEVLDSKN